MRVIGGTYRSRLLRAPQGRETRPTSDRLRETLFNVLAVRVAGARFLDLFCGTGAVGIEALSRGAAFVLFADSAPAAQRLVRANLQQLGIRDGFEVAERSVSSLLRRLVNGSRTSRPFDIVFLDPPYESKDEYRGALDLLGGAAGALLLAADAVVVAEHATREPLGERYGRLLRTRVLRQGDATLSFFGLMRENAAAEGEVPGA